MKAHFLWRSQDPPALIGGTTDDQRPWIFESDRNHWRFHVGQQRKAIAPTECDEAQWCRHGEVPPQFRKAGMPTADAQKMVQELLAVFAQEAQFFGEDAP